MAYLRRETTLDDATIDRMMREAEGRAHMDMADGGVRAVRDLLREDKHRHVAYGRGTSGLGPAAAPVMEQLTKDQALYERLVAMEEHRRVRRARDAAAARAMRARTPAAVAAEHRAAREDALARRQQDVERAREANRERHAESVAAERARREQEAADIERLRRERTERRAASMAAKKELDEERWHNRLERRAKEEEERRRLEHERADDELRRAARTSLLKMHSQQARRDARAAVQDLRRRQRERADADAQRVAGLLQQRQEDAERQRDANKDDIAALRRTHRDAMEAAAALRQERLAACREFAASVTPPPGSRSLSSPLPSPSATHHNRSAAGSTLPPL